MSVTRIQAIIFDLDDTLYPEKDFVESGYYAVARHIAGRTDYSLDELFSSMKKTFCASGRHAVFPRLLIEYPDAEISLDACVQLYRRHNPSIQLFPGYGDLLKELSGTYPLGMITDGLPDVQKNKVKALGLDAIIPHIIYSWDYGEDKQKPHPISFHSMLALLQSDAGATLFVGDNPEKDGQGAFHAGMRYAQITHFEETAADSRRVIPAFSQCILRSLFELPQLLQQ